MTDFWPGDIVRVVSRQARTGLIPHAFVGQEGVVTKRSPRRITVDFGPIGSHAIWDECLEMVRRGDRGDLRPWPHDPRYMVSSTGVIYGPRGRPLATRLHPNGRELVFMDNRTRFVAPVVCEAFHGPRPGGMHAAHKNGIKTDNRASNLSWKTPAENYADRDRHGATARGERTGTSRLTEPQVVEMRAIWALGEHTQREIAEMFGVALGTVSWVLTRRSWKHVA